MFTDRLTVCIPVFERVDFFEQAINSILNQTVKCNILVCDNNSSHNQFEKICQIHDIEYHKNPYNIGMFPNWNKCVEYCKTEFLLILGDDDILEANYVEEFLKTLEEYPSLNCYFTNIALLKGGQLFEHDFKVEYGYKSGYELLEYAAIEGLGIPTVSMVYQKQLFLNNEFLSTVHGSNDWLWLYSNLDGKWVYGNSKKLYQYRKHETSDSDVNWWSTYCKTAPVIFHKIFIALKKNGADKGILAKSKNAIYHGLENLLHNRPDVLKDLTKENNYFSDYYVKTLYPGFPKYAILHYFGYNPLLIKLFGWLIRLRNKVKK